MKYDFPKPKLKDEFYCGRYSENRWKLGESACVDYAFYALPNGSEYAIYKFVERTMSGGKKCRWEEWRNGKFVNNHFGGFDQAAKYMEREIEVFGFVGTRSDYRIYFY